MSGMACVRTGCLLLVLPISSLSLANPGTTLQAFSSSEVTRSALYETISSAKTACSNNTDTSRHKTRYLTDTKISPLNAEHFAGTDTPRLNASHYNHYNHSETSAHQTGISDKPPRFSHDPGFYSYGFDLEITHPDTTAVIHYTLDGSEPTSASRIYHSDQPIAIQNRSGEQNVLADLHTGVEGSWHPPAGPVQKAHTIRARVFKNEMAGQVATATFFIDSLAAERYSLPVVSLTADPDHFFSDQTGIYVPGTNIPRNYLQRGEDWERPVYLEFFSSEGDLLFRQPAGARIHGGSTRNFGQKSLRLYARSDYGESRFFYPVFPDLHYREYNRLLLRNSGDDWKHTMFRDALAQKLVEHLDGDTQAYRPVIVFLNGEYWGIHNFRERYDRHYLERVYGIDPARIDLLSLRIFRDPEIKEGDDEHYKEMINFFNTTNLSADTLFQQVEEWFDPLHFIDYYASQIYFGNYDWPQNNMDFWRLKTAYNPDAPAGHDGRWRWMLYDTDFSFGLYKRDFDMVEWLTREHWSTLILRSLLENRSFSDRFLHRIADHLNSTFSTERVLETIQSMASHIEPEISEHIHRWQFPSSVHAWHQEVAILEAFANYRPNSVRRHIMQHFNLEDTLQVTLSVSNPAAGSVIINELKISADTPGIQTDPWPWNGTYFKGIPIRLRALALPGYRFSHWDVSPNPGFTYLPGSTEIQVTLEYSKHFTAVFEPDEQPDFFPAPHALSENMYAFGNWPSDSQAGTYPDHMAFVYMDEADPGPYAAIEGFTGGSYNLETRSRIIGLGQEGFAFINTSSEEGNPGYRPGTRLGGALLALDTREVQDIEVYWEGRTVLPNSRVYHLRLQYRVGDQAPFTDLLDENGNPVEYVRNEKAGHHQWIGPARLPPHTENKAYVQLLWRYYFTGKQLDEESDKRSMLAVSNILVNGKHTGDVHSKSEKAVTLPLTLYQNYPNPFNSSTTIRYRLTEYAPVILEIYDLLGRNVFVTAQDLKPPGEYLYRWEAGDLPSGQYLLRLRAGDYFDQRMMMLIR